MDLAALYDDPAHFLKIGTSEQYDIDYDEIAKLQLHHFRERFRKLRREIPALGLLADDLKLDEITSFDDLASIAFPHTIYKTYAAQNVDDARFDRMTNWLQMLTAHDLSRVDAGDCTSIDTWLDRLAEQTPLRPGVTSGTSGKMSFFPRSMREMPYFLACVVRMFDRYRDEPMVDFASGQVPVFTAYPASTGRPGMLQVFRMLREQYYSGRTDMTFTFRDRHITTQELWLSAKWRKAQRLGETIILKPEEEALLADMLPTAEQTEALWDAYLDKIVVGHRGKTILFFGAWIQVYQIAAECRKRGIKIEWAPDSTIFTGGGTKGFVFPEGWRELIADAFPAFYPHRFREGYSMTETTASMICCSAEGHMHPLPSGIQHVVDPDTGKPLPRTGVQHGRLLVFDLLPDSYWSGTATGDGVTVNWDGGCSCGRKGPYFLNGMGRLSDMRGITDTIVCASKPDAYDRLEAALAQSDRIADPV